MIFASKPKIKICLNKCVFVLSVLSVTLFVKCATKGDPGIIIQANPEKNLYPIITEFGLVLTSTCGDGPAFKLVNPSKGQVIWERCDTIDFINNCYYNLTPYVYQNFLAVVGRNLLLVIDIGTGRTHQIVELEGSVYPHLTGEGGNVYFVVKSDKDPRQSISYSFNLLSGRLRKISEYYFNSVATSVITSPIPIGSDSTVFLQSSIDYKKGELTNSYFILWDESQEEKICVESYPDNQMGHGVSRLPILSEDKLWSYWQSTDGLVCFNHASMEVEWELHLGAGILSSKIEKIGDRLVYPSEAGVIYIVDIHDGAVVDTIENMPGTPGRLSVIELETPIIYFIGGADGRLYKVEMGQHHPTMSFQLIDFQTGKMQALRRQSIFTPEGFCVLSQSKWYCGAYERFTEFFASSR